MPRRLIVALLAGALVAGVAAAPASAGLPSSSKAPKMKRSSPNVKLATVSTVKVLPNGIKRMHFVYGPIHVNPGANNIYFEPTDVRPKENGYILSFTPNLITADGQIPRVDVIHLHHAVWLINGYPTFASGEEKTIIKMPDGFGYPYKTTDKWIMNHMIHNLTPNPDVVYITYDMDFLPASDPAAAKITPVRTQWMDVMGISGYPVFNAHRGQGTMGKDRVRRFTYPDQDTTIPPGYKRNQWVVNKPITLVATAGHLHPGGLYTDLKATRNGVTKLLFRSRAKYWEPAGAVSWDVAMTASPKNWRISLKPGDVISVHTAYDTTKASWYESMGIMPTAVADGSFGVDPFSGQKYPTTGQITHGPLAENRNHGGGPAGLPNPVKLLDGPVNNGGKQVIVDGFIYSQGNMSATGFPGRPPVVQQGGSIRFLNKDAQNDIQHTITACKAPCNRETGVAYPVANGPVDFDSGTLGFAQPGAIATAAAGRDTWSTPTQLRPGTYTYFCRIHPFMRGSFRVLSAKG